METDRESEGKRDEERRNPFAFSTAARGRRERKRKKLSKERVPSAKQKEGSRCDIKGKTSVILKKQKPRGKPEKIEVKLPRVVPL